MKRRVVITGIGLITALGNGTRVTWEGLLAGRSGVGPITRFDAAGFPTRFAAEVKNFDPMLWMEKKEVKKMDTFIHYALAASEFAMKDAGLSALTIRTANGRGSSSAPASAVSAPSRMRKANLIEHGPRRVSPFFIPSSIINLAAGQVSIRFGARGPESGACTACSAGSHAIGDSFRIIERGDADIMIAGGSEAAITPLAVGGFDALRALSTAER